MLRRRRLLVRRVLWWRVERIARGRRRRRRDAGRGTCVVLVRVGLAPGRQRGIDTPFPSTWRWVRRGLTLIAIYPRAFQITLTFTILLRLTLRSFAAIQRLASDIGKRVVIVGRVIVVFVSPFTFTITLVLLDGYARPQWLAIGDGEISHATAGFSLANVLADSDFDALVSKRAGQRGGL